MQKQLVVIAHNIRSAHNVGALLRTAEGLGITKVYLTGYTPYPHKVNDPRLPHIATKLHKQIQKTALDAELSVDWEQYDDLQLVFSELRRHDYKIAGLEQTANSVPLNTFTSPQKLALVLGSEVTGIDQHLLQEVDLTLEIPMSGKKESFNVVEAASMALFHCKLVSVV